MNAVSELATRWINGWPELAGNEEILHDYFHGDAVYEDVPMSFVATGVDEIGERYRTWVSAFTDITTRVESVTSEADRAVVHWVMSGRMSHDVAGIPATGRTFDEMHGVILVTVSDGRFTRMTKIYDALRCFGQLGILDSVAKAAFSVH